MNNSISDVFLKVHLNFIYLNELYKITNSKVVERVLMQPRRFHDNPFLIYSFLLLFVLFYPIYPLIKFLKFFLKKKTSHLDFPSNSNVYLMFVSRLYELAENAKILRTNDIWLVGDSSQICQIKSGSVVYMSSLLNRWEILKSLYYSIICFYRGLKVYGYKSALLNIWAFDFYTRYYACMHIPTDCHLFFCNHIDANYVLVDHLPHRKKTLIQHGTMIIRRNPLNLSYPFYRTIEQYKIWSLNLPYKLRTVNELYSFSEKEYEASASAMFVNKPLKHIVGYKLKKTEPIGNAKLKTVLIIGYSPANKEDEEKVIRYFSNKNVNLVLKVHPWDTENNYAELQSKYKFMLVVGAKYPTADIVFSYGSTLAYEYEELGSRVFFYDDIDLDNLDSLNL